MVTPPAGSMMDIVKKNVNRLIVQLINQIPKDINSSVADIDPLKEFFKTCNEEQAREKILEKTRPSDALPGQFDWCFDAPIDELMSAWGADRLEQLLNKRQAHLLWTHQVAKYR